MKDLIDAIVRQYFGADTDSALLDLLQPVNLPGGKWLFREGDPGDALYFLIQGRLQAWAGAEGQARLLGEVRPGDSVGEAGLLAGDPRSAGIRAIRDSFLVRLDKRDFEQLARRHPDMVMKLAGHVSRLMQQNLAGAQREGRRFKTICLLTLHESDRVQRSREALVQDLLEQVGGLALCPERLVQLGAPTAEGASLSTDLRRWLAEQEAREPLVVFLCGTEDSAWTRFVLRQSDLVVRLADATESPIPTQAERALHAECLQLLALHHRGETISGTAEWLSGRPIDHHFHLREGLAEDHARLVRVLAGTSVGLVLGAGAVRGLSELGVYKAMVELGIPVDWVGGSSIGSIVGGAIAMGWTPDHAIAMSRLSFVKGKPFSDYTLPVVSLIRGQRMMRLLRAQLDVAIEDLPIPYFCVSSRLDRGDVHVHQHGSLVEAIRASAALPGVLPPAVVEEELVVDGAVLNNLPVDIMRQKLVGSVVAVDVSSRHARRVDYEETPGSLAVLRGRWLPFSRRYRVPSLATLILRSTEIGSLAQARQRRANADLLISPPVSQFRMTDVKAFDPIVEVGYSHGLEALKAWQASREPDRDVPAIVPVVGAAAG